MIDVQIPKMGMSTVEVDISAVLVEPGEQVVTTTPIVEIESEKVTIAIEAGADGVVVEILVAPGDVRNVGDVVARIEEHSLAA